MTDSGQVELDIAVSPGAMLKAERLAQDMPEREAADRLNWMPDYVAVIESDNYDKLRSPAFARGYVKAYTRLLGLDQDVLIAAFDRNQEENASNTERAADPSLKFVMPTLSAMIRFFASSTSCSWV